jgi:HSP20 family protein
MILQKQIVKQINQKPMSVIIKEKGKIIPTLSTGIFESQVAPAAYMNGDHLQAGMELRMPCVNVIEGVKNYIIDLACPGFEKSDFNISVENGTLTIWSEKEAESLSKNEKETYRRKEFSYTSWSRSFQLPDHVLTDKIAATYTNGVLTIMVPKNEVSSTKPVKEISVR